MALGMLVDGKWVKDWTERDEKGRFNRMPTHFHNTVTADGSSGFKAEPGRYHLYVSLGCPWAHRTVIMRKLKGLEDVISLSIVDPVISEEGWTFSDAPECIPDVVNGTHYLREVYTLADLNYSGRVTVPVLWDKQTGAIVNNESRQIIRMFDTEFAAFSTTGADLYPKDFQQQIDQTIDEIYQPINNGVYRSGFANSQEAYEEAVTELFAALDRWEEVLENQRYLCGDRFTEADICMFTTLFRFDLAYHGLFKCNLRRLVDYPNLWGYLRDLYQHPGVAEVCSIEHVKRLYYAGIPQLNPNRIVPLGPAIDFSAPHNRARLGNREMAIR
ncbi:glutathione S-transferase family protein [Leptolyngbya sp. FACHB-541]|uniref:glutathione S-transferase family protein n=1 Tax=Leptolyngbya sp. FACHB-541 TaxID=2692810 RepID=UPI0024114B9E|nr:glutathione S-transferase family protein [Leptolyngbya sp. FACHB-541]